MTTSAGEISANARALLHTIRLGEGTSGEAGYQTMFGGKTFDLSGGHPRSIQKGRSDAAGAYQFLSTTWDEVAKQLGTDPRDFSPAAQDRAALHLVRRRGVDPDAELTPESLAKLAPEWASLPTLEGKSYYGQPVKGRDELLSYYRQQRSGGGSTSGTPALQQVQPLQVQPLQVLQPSTMGLALGLSPNLLAGQNPAGQNLAGQTLAGQGIAPVGPAPSGGLVGYDGKPLGSVGGKGGRRTSNARSILADALKATDDLNSLKPILSKGNQRMAGDALGLDLLG